MTSYGPENQFVKALILPEPHEYEALAASVSAAEKIQPVRRRTSISGEPSAQVNAGSLTSFVQGVTGLQKADVMNSTLLAQLSANKAYDRFKDPMNWYKYYTNVLGQVGWNIPGFAFDTYTSGGSTIELDTAVLGILTAIATAGEIALIAATMKSFKSLSDGSKPLKIWDANASSGNNGNFQIFPVANVNDTPVMLMCGMQFNAKTSHDRFLWFTWFSTNINVQRAANKFELNNNVYSRVRQQIIDKLGDRASTFVADLDI